MGKPTENLEPDPLIGRQFGSYEILSKIAAGGMGTVYRAQHIKLAKIVAVKVLAGNMAAVEEYVLRFEREAQLAARLEHPNIVRIYDYGTDGEVIYLVMQFVSGESLAARMKRDKKLPILEAMHITREIAKGLDIAHEKGLVHRDIKPDNILISKRNEIMITDFGLVKLETEQDSPDQSPIETVDSSVTAELTIGGSILGTPYYMSPEQCQGLPDIDARADLYSLGLILYGLLTGQVPAEGKNAMMIMQNRLLYDPTPPINLNPAIGEPLNDLVLHLLQREPENRLATARLLVQRLTGLFPLYARKAKGQRGPSGPRPRMGSNPNMAPRVRPPSGPATRPPPAPRTPSPPPIPRPPSTPTGPPPPQYVTQSGEMAFTDFADGEMTPTPYDTGPRPVFVQPPISAQKPIEKFRNFYESDDRPPPPPPPSAPVEEPGLEGFQPLPSNVSLAPTPKSQQELDEYYQPAPPAPELTPEAPAPLETQSLFSPKAEGEVKSELPSYMRALDTNIPTPAPIPEKAIPSPRGFPRTLLLLLILTAVAGGAFLYFDKQEKVDLDFVSISETPEWTNKRELEIEGQLNRGNVKIALREETIETDDDGYFKKILSLRSGRNEFVLNATDKDGHSTIKTFVIMLDDSPPKLYFETLFRGKLFLDSKAPILEGEVRDKNPGTLFINDKPVKIDKEGLFKVPFDGKIKKVQISVTDLAGNKSTKSYSIVYRPEVEFKDFKAPGDYTNVQKHTISGVASRLPAKLKINLSKIPLDEKGAFQYDCTLRNGKNNYVLRLQAEDGGIGVKNLIIIYDPKLPVLTMERVFGERIFLSGPGLQGNAKDKYLGSVTVNEKVVKTDNFGSFVTDLDFNGKDFIPVKIVVRDLAGNVVEQSYDVYSNKYRGWITKPIVPEFVTTDSVILTGQFSVGELFLLVGDNKIRADDQGRFQLKVPLKPGANQFQLQIKLPEGGALTEEFSIERRTP